MTKIFNSKLLSLGLILVLIATMALTFTACKDEKTPVSTAPVSDGATLGEGATSFALEIVDKEGNKVSATIKTDETTVGDALIALNVIAGEEGDYGLYVKTVNNLTLDYDTDGYYWAFYVNGEYAMTGVDATEIDSGAVYALKAEK